MPPPTINIGRNSRDFSAAFSGLWTSFATETNAQGVPTLCAVWPSCRRSLGVHRWRSHAAYGAETRRSGAACRQCGGNCAGLVTRPASSVAPPDHSGVAGATTAEATLLSANFALGDTFQDRRQPGRPAVRQTVNSLRACSQDLQENLWTTDRDKQLLSELRQASAMALPRCVVSRYATSWAGSIEGAMNGHQSWALLCRFRCRLVSA